MTAAHSSELSNRKPETEDEISLLDLLLVLTKHKKLIIGLPILAAVIAAAVALGLPNQYTATLKIAPSKNAAVYNWVLNNDQVKETIAKDMKLVEHFDTKGRQATRNAMGNAVKVTLNAKDGFLDINVTDKNPEFAALLANKMGLALQSNLYSLRLLDSSKLRYELETR
ncbi:Wzz/FepE/Etk N-terminal domain-containing protein [uncultured Deefgea sp.]|uniref:Wzz/FepE/Etk N-terminal domain-containing protein n=1 Tax=uncultured Deefgea sp. TaxID=1304914 RepID=UPI002604F6BD|nr:Wzz/FepE/Etk N-terminal domain-containing protein [uncultured Deefgea sp.]